MNDPKQYDNMIDEKENSIEDEKVRSVFSLVLAILSMVVILLPIILRGSLDPIKFAVISTAVITAFYILSRKMLTNIFTFSLILLLLSVVFPLAHYLIYKNNKANYHFESDLLSQKATTFQEEFKDHIDTSILYDILKANGDSILIQDVRQISDENILFLNGHLLKFELVEVANANHPGIMKRVIGIYNSTGKKLGVIDIGDRTTIKGAIAGEIATITRIRTLLANPEETVLIGDFWVESITGFAFGQIKPISNFAKTIRVFQLMFAFLFLAMVTNTLRSSGMFVVEKIKQ